MRSGFGVLYPQSRQLIVAPWAILVACPALLLVILRFAPQYGSIWITVSLILFFPVLLLRLWVTALRQRERRVTVIYLLLGVLSFAVGSAVLDSSGTTKLTHFPSPGEFFFLASYVFMAAYLVRDASRSREVAAARWLEAAVICGGCASAAGALVFTLAASRIDGSGLQLLLAILYPLLDIVLALVVAGQVALGMRSLRDAAPLMAGFGLFAVADCSFLLHLSGGTYDFGDLSIVTWGIGLALIVGNAAQRRRWVDRVSVTDGMTVPVLAAGTAAAFVLAFTPTGSVHSYLAGPALATLAATGARLVLALRAATRAAEAMSLARSDDLTGLPNRRAMLALVEQRLTTTKPLGLMIIDLDGFKEINDTLGHAAGDAILRGIATRVRSAVDSSVMFSRLGGDEFAVVTSTEDEVEMMELANRILSQVRQQFVIDGIGLTVDASIGITAREATDTSSGELLRRADVAMYTAKEGRINIALYDPETDEFSRERLSLSDELRRGIADGQLVLWYQPQYAAPSQIICGLEALVRWQHPTRGMLHPAEFLPVARRSGLMQALSDEIGRIAVADLERWATTGWLPKVAINCAAPELLSGIFVPRLAARLERKRIPAHRIVIEVTEDLFLAEPERARVELLRIRSHGFQISIDDYGSGFSSLSYLRDLPVNELKLDRSFVATAVTDPRSRMIAASTLQMAAALGLRSVAEGVEDAATAAEFVRLGADVLQGYHLSRPLPPEAIPGLLAERITAHGGTGPTAVAV